MGFQGKPDVIFKNGYVHVVYQDLATDNVIYRRGTIADVTEINEMDGVVLDVYPNPTTQIITVNGLNKNNIADIKTINTLGQEFSFSSKWISTNSVQLDFGSTIKKGVYFLQFVLENGTSISKAITVN